MLVALHTLPYAQAAPIWHVAYTALFATTTQVAQVGGGRKDVDTLSEELFRQLASGALDLHGAIASASASSAAATEAAGRAPKQQQQQQQHQAAGTAAANACSRAALQPIQGSSQQHELQQQLQQVQQQQQPVVRTHNGAAVPLQQ